jgi:hypothetical protein
MRLNLIHNNTYIKNLYHLHINMTILRSPSTPDVSRLMIDESNKENTSKQDNKNSNTIRNSIGRRVEKQ